MKVRYCSVPCQQEDRDRHEPECIEATTKRRHRLALLLSAEEGGMEGETEGETKSASSPTKSAVDLPIEDREDDDEQSSSITTSSVGASVGETKTPKEPDAASIKREKNYTEMFVKAQNLTIVQLVLAKNETNVNRRSTLSLQQTNKYDVW